MGPESRTRRAGECAMIILVRAMVLHAQREPLRLEEVPAPEPGPGQILMRVHACGVCRTDLHIVDGDLTKPKLP
ncbi:MAG TPA: alcohol dehydrogenase catalytic domain-containing protein, partial [Solirubrobacterales bacterium]|nr:alcohol dehydrogenase catalytic domain-containing protein [Solirubrobacterales bacterium]